MAARDELLEQFLLEGRELVAAAGEELTALGGGAAGDPARLDSLFRAVHTLKGSAALFDLPGLTALLHAAESALEASRREGRLRADDAAAAIRAIDLTDAWLDALDGAGPTPALEAETEAAAALLQGAARAPAADAAQPSAGPPDWARALAEAAGLDGAGVAIRYRPARDAYFRGDDPLALVRSLPGLGHLRMAVTQPPDDPYDPFQCLLELQAVAAAPLADVRAVLRFVIDQAELAEVERFAAAATDAPEAGISARSVRVEARRLDELAAMADELVIAKNELLRRSGFSDAARGGDAAAGPLERIVADLHGSVMALRLTPLRPLFDRFPRRVRDIAASLGKDVEFVMSGEGVAVDKAVVEGLFTPLLHLIRNALDHGIERPTVRRAAGKPERARLALSAVSHGDTVTVELADDGAGIDVGRIRQAALSRGLISAAGAASLPDDEAVLLVFTPGFSTADQVSDLSGRGVGMDAVRAEVARLGGRVSLDNRPGQGLSVRLTLPARVVLTKVLVIEAGGQRFGAPLEAVAEMHQVAPAEISEVRAGRAYVRRDSVIPLLGLAALLGLNAAERDAGPIAVLTVDAGGERIGIEVERVAERMEAPLRPMAGLLTGFPGVLGTILQADGQVLLVLDLAELAQRGGGA